MEPRALYAPLKALALAVLLLMLAAMIYAGYMSMTHWTGIGV